MRKSKSVKSSASGLAANPRRKSASIHLAVAFFFIAGLTVITLLAKGYVDEHVAGATGPLRVVLKNKPVWMSSFLAEQIAATVPRSSSSAFDRDLLQTASDQLRANPWVLDVKQVRRVYGQAPGDTLEVDCDFRAPIALVRWQQYFWLVDGDGVKLPEQFAPSHVPRIVMGNNGRMNIRVIEGVKESPPATGMKWSGGDLAAGLGLVKLLYGKDYAEQVVSVDVSNFAGRRDSREAQLVLRTAFATEIRWGRPAGSDDYFAEVPVGQKLNDLKALMQQYGRVDAGQPWIDVRFDKITYPTPVQAGSTEAAAKIDVQ